MTYGIVIPNRFPDIIEPLIESIHVHIPKPHPRIIIVADGHTNDYGFEMVPYTEDDFVFSKSANLGIKALSGLDVILLNDDCVVLEDNFFDRLFHISLKNMTIGILSPLIKGCVGNAVQRWHERHIYWKPKILLSVVRGTLPICFPCVFLRRRMIDDIGLLDETFTGYGGEDNEYCKRARKRRWVTAVTSELVIQHGDGGEEIHSGHGKTWSCSFARPRWPVD